MSKLAQVLKSHSDINGITLYDHLNKYLNEIYQSNHQDINTCELLSDFVKKNRFLFKSMASDKEVNDLKDRIPDFKEWAQKVSEILSSQTVSEMPTILQNFVADAKLLEQAGLGLGEEESYTIQLSIKKLALETQAQELVFFGKILCRNKDYYVAMGVLPQLPTDHLPANVEIRGDGTNFYTFWVTHDVLTDWIELPLSTPEQIRGARDIKYICTGDLNADIKSYPQFPGKEKHYLKAQLARICHANLIAPKGLYKVKEDNPKELEFEEEFKLPEFPELKVIDTWVHVPGRILKSGRITHYVDPQMSEEAKATLEEQDPLVERLLGISEDKGVDPEQPYWLVKVMGDEMAYGPKEEGGNNNLYSVALLKNYTWPGAVTITNQNGWAFFYIGYGFKENQASFVPIQNNDLQVEPDDINEFPDPNPKNPPKPPQEENPEGQENAEGQENQEDEDQQ